MFQFFLFTLYVLRRAIYTTIIFSYHTWRKWSHKRPSQANIIVTLCMGSFSIPTSSFVHITVFTN